MERNKERFKDTATNSYRKINMVDLAQATLAFLGEPGDAKDRSRFIFENETTYKKVFPDSITPEQLLLPWNVYQQAEAACASWPQFSGSSYARFCLTAIVGTELAPSGSLPSPHEATRMTIQQDRVGTIIHKGQQAITSLIAALGEKDYPGHREFFRSAGFFTKIINAYRAMPS